MYRRYAVSLMPLTALFSCWPTPFLLPLFPQTSLLSIFLNLTLFISSILLAFSGAHGHRDISGMLRFSEQIQRKRYLAPMSWLAERCVAGWVGDIGTNRRLWCRRLLLKLWLTYELQDCQHIWFHLLFKICHLPGTHITIIYCISRSSFSTVNLGSAVKLRLSANVRYTVPKQS